MGKTELDLRRTGRTTRLVDKYVQDYFTSTHVVIRDHVPNTGCHEDLAELVTDRLIVEHHIIPIRSEEVNSGLPVLSSLPYEKE